MSEEPVIQELPQQQRCDICREERYFVTDGACRSCHFAMHCEGYE